MQSDYRTFLSYVGIPIFFLLHLVNTYRHQLRITKLDFFTIHFELLYFLFIPFLYSLNHFFLLDDKGTYDDLICFVFSNSPCTQHVLLSFDNDLHPTKLYDKPRNLTNEATWSFLFTGVKLTWEDDSCRYDVS